MGEYLFWNLSVFLQALDMEAMDTAAIQPQQATVSVRSFCLHLGSYSSVVWV